jgi:AraC-like DNA-binding protein
MTEPLYAIGWGWQYPDHCPILAWRNALPAETLREEMARPATSLCLFPIQFADLPGVAASGMLLPLDGLFPASDLKRNPSWLLAMMRANDTLFALPEDITPTCLLARTDLLSKHGLKPPTDWEELLNQSRYLKKKLGQPGIVLPKPTASTFAILVGSLMSANGINPMDDPRRLLKNPQPLKETYRMMHAFREFVSGLPEGNANPREALAGMFSIGAAPYFLCYPSTIRDWSSEILQRVRAYPIPHGPSVGRKTPARALVRGTCWCIPRNTRSPETAVKALRILRRTSVVKKIELSGGHPFSAFTPLWNDPQVRQQLPLYRDAKRFFPVAQTPIIFHMRNLIHYGATMKESFDANESDDGWLQRLCLHISGDSKLVLKHHALRKAIQLIDQKLPQVSRIQSLAERVGVSVTHLERLFRSETGLSCGKYLRQRQMKCAHDLLVHSTQAVKEIAYRLGYTHATHFSRDVRAYWKKTPAEIRASSLKDSK